MRRSLLVATLLLALVIPTAPAPARSGTDAAAAQSTGAGRPWMRGLPPGVPAATRRSEPRLAPHDGWPFSEAFPRTSGTRRYYDGALLWTDFLYDDNGAITGPSADESAGAYSFGTYVYPRAQEAGNGADIFRTAVAADRYSTWWRVDWNTLVDASVPAAAFGIDLNASGGPPRTWSGNVGVASAGLDRTLVITAAGAFLDGRRVAATRVDREAKSFVARIPLRVLRPAPRSRVWLAAGLANARRDGFLSLGPPHRHGPGQPNVFNLGFRDYADEPVDKNFWLEKTQATVLSQPDADVTRFGLAVDWTQLRKRVRQPEPLRRGYSNRWYVSSVAPGDGRVTTTQSNADRRPDYLGRVQPYGVYIPRSYRPSQPAPLTWLLHSLAVNHNQYGATTPNLLRQACEARRSICATPLGRGPDGYYRGLAELDFWEVWRSLHAAYALDRDRTIVAGYSMGGFGAFNFALDHPDVFAGMVVLASAANEDLPRLENAKWTPYYHGHGAGDQLVPYGEEAQPTVAELDRLGYRYRFDTYLTKDHVAWSLEDGFGLAAQWMAEGDRKRPADPAHFVYRWFPAEVDARLGIGPSGAWWVRNVVAADRDRDGRVGARSYYKPLWPITRTRTSTPMADERGAPVVREELAWRIGSVADLDRLVSLRLDNVASGDVNLRRSGLPLAPGSRVRVVTDSPARVRLLGVPSSLRLLLNNKPVTGTTVAVAKGVSTITFARRTR